MLISTRSRYGLRALAEMARGEGEKPVSLGELAANEDVSTRYLEQIFARLRTKGIVRGRRGPGGGYVLARRPSEITLFEIICALENCMFSPSCIGDLPGMPKRRREEPDCEKMATCVTRKLWMAMRDSCSSLLMGNTLEDLVQGNIRRA